MDWGIGRLLEVLEENNLRENTLIIFSSDNGPVLFDGYYDGAVEKNDGHRPAGPYRGGKYSAWEGGTRAPFIVSWPGVVDAGITDALLSQVDLIASLAALTGATIPEGAAMDSRNLIDTLTGKSESGRAYLIQQGVNMEAIRKGPWKYVPPGYVTTREKIGHFNQERVNGAGALFYLPEDPSEQENLAYRYPAKVRELREILQRELAGKSNRDSKEDALGGAVQK
jgi:arylsulfatase A-like enzyme